ncbi:glutamate ABC transporter substrate-binding protein [Streptacidiphilus carbonis]|uniref:glutamate ABC transporter substrate-binding protein n=1 Tax=Streptacidiphilus carbonis TaxID=105422 RepID=UPI0006949C94|nr:glutamate ABC transporter substrate-binding protein [Streptacidiphilus carbonis]
MGKLLMAMGTGRRTRVTVLAAAAVLLGSLALPGSSAAEPRPQSVRIVGGTPALAPAAASCNTTTGLTPSTDDSGANVQKIVKRGKLIAGIDTNSDLWGFRDPVTGNLQGFDIDLVHALAKSILGDANAVEFLAVPTANRITALQSGQVDVVVRTMTITCDRLKQVSFSVPYFYAGQEVVAPKSSSITGLNDTLKGRTVCAASGSTGLDQLNADKHGAKVMQVANQLDCLVQMQLGNVDATVTDNALGAGQVAQDPTIHLVGGLLDQEVYGVAMKLGSTDLVRRVNAAMQDFLANQWVTEYNKWLKPLGSSPGAPVPHFAG